MKIAIDIGHADGTGALGNGLEEHAVCSRIAEQLKAFLRCGGCEVETIDHPELTNSEDLAESITALNAMDDIDLVVSLHADASANTVARGAHVCYVSRAGETAAVCIASRLYLGLPGRADRVQKRSDLAILNKTTPVTVLVECGFITNKSDASVLGSQAGRIRIAADIAAGVLAYGKLI